MFQTSLLVALVIAGPVYAEGESEITPHEPGVYQVERGGILTPGSSSVMIVGKGIYIDEAVAIAIAQDINGLKAENQRLKQGLEKIITTPPDFPLFVVIGTAVLGVVAGYVAARRVGK